MRVEHYDIETQECNHFHLNGRGVNPSFEKVQIRGRTLGGISTRPSIYIHTNGKFLQERHEFHDFSRRSRYLLINNAVHRVRSSLTQRRVPMTVRDDIVDYVARDSTAIKRDERSFVLGRLDRNKAPSRRRLNRTHRGTTTSA